jgi:hypothetical protein
VLGEKETKIEQREKEGRIIKMEEDLKNERTWLLTETLPITPIGHPHISIWILQPALPCCKNPVPLYILR